MYLLEFKSFSKFVNLCYWWIMYWDSVFFQLCFRDAPHPFDQRPPSGSQWLIKDVIDIMIKEYEQTNIKFELLLEVPNTSPQSCPVENVERQAP